MELGASLLCAGTAGGTSRAEALGLVHARLSLWHDEAVIAAPPNVPALTDVLGVRGDLEEVRRIGDVDEQGVMRFWALDLAAAVVWHLGVVPSSIDALCEAEEVVAEEPVQLRQA